MTVIEQTLPPILEERAKLDTWVIAIDTALRFLKSYELSAKYSNNTVTKLTAEMGRDAIKELITAYKLAYEKTLIVDKETQLVMVFAGGTMGNSLINAFLCEADYMEYLKQFDEQQLQGINESMIEMDEITLKNIVDVRQFIDNIQHAKLINICQFHNNLRSFSKD
jgi:hypothetical protein